jgi:hypothetical protein
MYSILAISLGLIGNLLGIASTFKKKLIGCGPLLMFRHLFIFDMISMFIFSNFFLEQLFGIDFKMISSVACKLYYYAGFQAASVSPLVHVYITVERFLSIKYPIEFSKYTVYKGSITISGVSLTINKCDDDFVELCIIPITLSKTNLGLLNPGSPVNIEFDILAKYTEKLLIKRDA